MSILQRKWDCYILVFFVCPEYKTERIRRGKRKLKMLGLPATFDDFVCGVRLRRTFQYHLLSHRTGTTFMTHMFKWQSHISNDHTQELSFESTPWCVYKSSVEGGQEQACFKTCQAQQSSKGMRETERERENERDYFSEFHFMCDEIRRGGRAEF